MQIYMNDNVNKSIYSKLNEFFLFRSSQTAVRFKRSFGFCFTPFHFICPCFPPVPLMIVVPLRYPLSCLTVFPGLRWYVIIFNPSTDSYTSSA